MAIGVQVNINPGAGSPVIGPSPLNVVAMLVKSNRGPMNIPIPMTSIGDYEVKFGQPRDSSAGEVYQSYYNAKAIWGELNTGQTAVVYGLRVGTTGATATTGTTISPTYSFSAAWQGYDSPGTGGNDIKVVFAQLGTTGRWSLDVYEKDPVGTAIAGSDQLVLRESYSDLTTTNIDNQINVARPSNYIKFNGTAATFTAYTGYLAGGTNGTVAATDITSTNLSLLDSYAINYLCAPDFMDDTANSGTACDNMGTYCTSRGDITAIVAAPSSYSWDSTGLMSWGMNRQKSMVFMTGYFGWFRINDNYNIERTICPVGHIIGAYWIRKMFLDGQIAHSAPGGVTSPIRTIKGLQKSPNNQVLSNSQIDLVRAQVGVNTTKFESGFGYVLLTSRSFSTDSRFYNSHRNRSTNFLVQSFKPAFLYYNQRPNNDTTRGFVTGAGDTFLARQYDLGMFDTDVASRDQSYQIICTASNNPAAIKTQRWLQIDVYVKYVEVNELVRINLNQVEIGTQITIK